MKHFLKYLRIARFLPQAFFNARSLPLYLVFFVTHRCIANCKHCFNWPRRSDVSKSEELTLDEVEKISRSLGRIIFIFLTGGEPFLRDDLFEIAKIFYRNNGILKYQIPSNGWFTEKIISQVRKMAIACPQAHTSVTISIDGINGDHDRIRGVKGLFEKAIRTINEMKKLAKFHSNIGVNAEITVSAYNQHTAGDTFKYLSEKIGVANIFVPLIRGIPKDYDCKNIDIEFYERICREIEESFLSGKHVKGYTGFPFSSLINYKDICMRKIVSRIVRDNKNIVPCIAGRLYGILYATGDVEFCEMVDKQIGNVRDFDYDFKKVWSSKKARKVSREIVAQKCFCTHECALSASMIANPKYLFKIVWDCFKRKLSM